MTSSRITLEAANGNKAVGGGLPQYRRKLDHSLIRLSPRAATASRFQKNGTARSRKP
jgi:hypothetical protein